MIKPQDVVVLTKIATLENDGWTFLRLGQELRLAPSVVFDSLKRGERAGLYDPASRRVVRERFEHFLVNCVEYLCPGDEPLSAALPELAERDPVLGRLRQLTDALRSRVPGARDRAREALPELLGAGPEAFKEPLAC